MPVPAPLPEPAPRAASPAVSARTLDQTSILRGLYRFTANEATFEDCVSGARLPVAQEGANVVLESAYLRLFAGGGNDAAVLATIAGRVLPRAAPDGRVRNSLVVDGFLSLGGDACPSNAPAPLAVVPGSTAPPAPENTR